MIRDRADTFRKLILISILFTAVTSGSAGQVRIRLFAGQNPESVFININEGRYEIDAYDGHSSYLTAGETVIITLFRDKLAVKTRTGRGFICDSVIMKGTTGNDSFTCRKNGADPVRRLYSDDLQCFPDLDVLLMINICDMEKYIAGVVKTEGGTGKNIEYFKSQAVLVRTYLYDNMDRHIMDNYNLCDETHCQAFHGYTGDPVISKAAEETKGLVILDKDSVLVFSAFHSNCGGETSPAEEVWLSGKPYLKKVVDPYCTSSRNAGWQKSLTLSEWVGYLRKNGFGGSLQDPDIFDFTQLNRVSDYRAGSFSIPLRLIRNDLDLRSSFFSVFADKDSVILKGRGYGHGVGLCQEGAMVMASRGFDFRKIIGFYYTDVIISDIKNARESVID